ncbi:hypothetical protein [Bathymodiolus thermophilus thioautotrophic gill symbiont]|uniref:DGQHR domain-containing protein n=1 Tax=Bathymodiolus thermophilus thioautotrophic gill symbiont TaxID=2360 RepID=A0A1J5UAX9_9GAMM|nr:hypothetical protein [Bathymodiolus thermophilus thioautotrophic gill symbiont]OIR25529.1 hypothetical protein BGC33_06960 [Bathymodiolus thermophilus thioautotrophic gill symbiont]
MILRGILDRSLGNMVCIRGFAKMGDLAQISKADKSYQRDLIADHEQEILKFLNKRETLFFPEVILSYSVDIDEIPLALEGFRYSKDKNLKITTKTNKYPNKQDARGGDKIQIATIDIIPMQTIFGFDEGVVNKVFNRIDGNHRLSVVDRKNGDTDIQELITPFCLLLLPKQFEQNSNSLTASKLEKTIFHNINYKHIPLEKEQHYKMIIGDNSIFTDIELTNNFGEVYFLARQYLREFKYDFSDLKTLLSENKYTFTHDLQKILSDKDSQTKRKPKEINDALRQINRIYTNHEQLAKHQHYGLLIAFVYFAVRKNKKLSSKELNAFASWVVDNFVYEIVQKDANSIIAMYEKIIEKRYKEIFISMDFSPEYKPTYEAIKGVIVHINTEYQLQEKIKLSFIRIDQFQTGYSYKLDDEILKQIEQCGLMIADLSSSNINVYQEVGFAIGLNHNIDRKDILLLKEDIRQDKSSDGEVGFNLRSTKQLRFIDTENLRKKLTKELVEYYKLND